MSDSHNYYSIIGPQVRSLILLRCVSTKSRLYAFFHALVRFPDRLLPMGRSLPSALLRLNPWRVIKPLRVVYETPVTIVYVFCVFFSCCTGYKSTYFCSIPKCLSQGVQNGTKPPRGVLVQVRRLRRYPRYHDSTETSIEACVCMDPTRNIKCNKR